MTAALLGLAQAEDTELLRVAHEQNRLFVTRDRDFGGLVFVQGGSAGVFYLRILPSTQNSVHSELERVLTLYSESELQTSFVVIEPGRHRIRRLSAEVLRPADQSPLHLACRKTSAIGFPACGTSAQ